MTDKTKTILKKEYNDDAILMLRDALNWLNWRDEHQNFVTESGDNQTIETLLNDFAESFES